MSKITSKMSNSFPCVISHTLTAQDISDSYLTADFHVAMPLAGIVTCRNQNGVSVNMNTAKISYPLDGEIKIESTGVGIAEKNTITTVADVANSLGGKYLLLSSPTVNYYAWFDSAGVAEVSSVDTIADTDGSLGGITAVNEITSVDTIADIAGSLNSKYFRIDSFTVPYYVWYNINSLGVDPSAANVGRTGVEIAAATGATAAAVATATKAVLDAVGGAGVTFSCTIGGAGSNEMTITHVVAGSCANATAGNSGFTVAVDQQGVTFITSGYFDISSPTVNYRVWYNADSQGTIPTLSGRTSVPVAIVKNETLANVATKTKAVIDALGTGLVFSTAIGGGSSNQMTITNLVRGLATDAAAGTSGFTVATDIQGAAKSTDPTVATRTAIEVPIVTGDSANSVATKLRAVLEAHAAFTASVLNNVVTVTNSVIGKALDIGAGNSGMTVSISDQGVSVSSALTFEVGNILTIMAFLDSNQL
jgi:hypothetical protein